MDLHRSCLEQDPDPGCHVGKEGIDDALQIDGQVGPRDGIQSVFPTPSRARTRRLQGACVRRVIFPSGL